MIEALLKGGAGIIMCAGRREVDVYGARLLCVLEHLCVNAREGQAKAHSNIACN
jgi:hypothetical protein